MKISKFAGYRNVGLQEKFADGELTSARNVFFHDDGAIETRDGYDVVLSAVGAKDLYSVPDGLLFTVGKTLNIFYKDASSATLYNLMHDGQMNYATVAGKVYMTNDVDTLVYSNGSVSVWGVQPPLKTQAESIAGDLIPGMFQVCTTYIISDGSETGTSGLAVVDAQDGGVMLRDIVPSDSPSVVGIAVYMTQSGGEVQGGGGLYRVAVLPNEYVDRLPLSGGIIDGVKCATFNMVPPPAGQCIGFYRGRIYIGSGPTLWYTQPWMYSLVSLDWGHIPLKGMVTMIQPVENGIWVGTDTEFAFISGTDPMADGGFKVRSRTSIPVAYGSVSVSSADILLRGMSPGQTAVWVGKDGIYAGDGNGIFTNMTAGKWVPDHTNGRCGILDNTHGMLQYTFALNA